ERCEGGCGGGGGGEGEEPEGDCDEAEGAVVAEAADGAEAEEFPIGAGAAGGAAEEVPIAAGANGHRGSWREGGLFGVSAFPEDEEEPAAVGFDDQVSREVAACPGV